MTHKAVHSITINSTRWIGSLSANDAAQYVDNLLMLILGGIPWQVYFQRVLSARTARGAQMLSYMASLGCLIMAIPSILIGAVAASTDWSATEYKGTVNNIIIPSERKLVLPLVLQYLCPPAISFVGLGAVSAAVMSSADSSVFSAASMFAHNVVKPLFPSASERCILLAMKCSILAVGSLACLLGIMIESIYDLWFLSSDLVYVILFPQLISVLFIPFTNTYGSLAGFIVGKSALVKLFCWVREEIKAQILCYLGLFLRLTSGEKAFGLPVLFYYPGYDYETGLQRSPVKTIAMLGSLAVSTAVSYLMHRLWLAGKLEGRRDFFGCMSREVQAPMNGRRTVVGEKRTDVAKSVEFSATCSIEKKIANVQGTELEEKDKEVGEEDEEDAGIPLTKSENGKGKWSEKMNKIVV